MLAFARCSLLVLLPFAGCASPWPKRVAVKDLNGAEAFLSRTTTADWDDVETSLLTAASQTQCSFVSLAIEGDVWKGEAISIHDDSIVVVVERGEKIVLCAEPTATSDEATAGLLLDAAVKRLRQLHGVKTAPMDGPER